MKYQKKPMVVEAIRYMGDTESDEEVEDFIGFDSFTFMRPIIKTLKGDMVVHPGDYIIKGVAGEFYPCRPDIFEETYVAVSERHDSVEQVALDMLNNLCGITTTASIDAKALDAGVMAEGRRRYADRLRALGVEVSQ